MLEVRRPQQEIQPNWLRPYFFTQYPIIAVDPMGYTIWPDLQHPAVDHAFIYGLDPVRRDDSRALLFPGVGYARHNVIRFFFAEPLIISAVKYDVASTTTTVFKMSYYYYC